MRTGASARTPQRASRKIVAMENSILGHYNPLTDPHLKKVKKKLLSNPVTVKRLKKAGLVCLRRTVACCVDSRHPTLLLTPTATVAGTCQIKTKTLKSGAGKSPKRRKKLVKVEVVDTHVLPSVFNRRDPKVRLRGAQPVGQISRAGGCIA